MTANMARLVIVYRKIGELTLDPNNARTHSPEQVQSLADLITEHGMNQPISIRPTDVIGAGEGRYLACQLLKMEEVPTVTLDMTEEQWEAYAIADNRIALSAGWNEERLKASLERIAKMGNAARLTAFKPKELGRLGITGFPRVTPNFQAGPPKFEIIMECADEADQAAMLDQLMKQGRVCRALL